MMIFKQMKRKIADRNCKGEISRIRYITHQHCKRLRVMVSYNGDIELDITRKSLATNSFPMAVGVFGDADYGTVRMNDIEYKGEVAVVKINVNVNPQGMKPWLYLAIYFSNEYTGKIVKVEKGTNYKCFEIEVRKK